LKNDLLIVSFRFDDSFYNIVVLSL